LLWAEVFGLGGSVVKGFVVKEKNKREKRNIAKK